ncbi:Fucoxanthin-chlorophyll a-c binding protein A, chloroplastic [Gracilariopsis chorda]|uniref:Fucoxanthin-chlorophyll a-c binding protein A, chloroplastic n=1 Tax=Gracilariopsis chorda TaxID=448386 RepID=A0A2V3IPQ1_9FLOR|nr:Fucoxanthin-chlorophyll a-c binding protein A, chloroplastic [Gracilariopsis chorda]|eukprot:PXF44052.1 Fucoxanthin-chlorophyll a-c binding protein A, chloroplastic [Gracilariopsis chorda]
MVAFIPALALGSRPALARSSICGAQLSHTAVSRGAVRMSESSPSVPFLAKPRNLSEDMPGYAGFDPFALSDNIDVKWLQQAEIKHGRVCMLAFLGFLVQEFVHLPGPEFANPVATEALFQVPAAGLWQIFLFCGLMEFIGHKGKITYVNMFEDGAVPGELGFNPMGLKITERVKLQEIKNGRLAMVGVGGVIHSMLLYKVPVIAQLLDFKPMALPYY